ncbi:MAG: MFS transporter [Candidatus Thorarchaeota archaeon]
MSRPNPESNKEQLSILKKVTPDFNSMIRITFWNGLGFIFFMFIKSYVVIYFFGGSGVQLGIIMALQPFARLISMPFIAYLTDYTSKKKLVLIGSMGRTISYFLYWLSLVIRNLYMFGMGTFLQGLLVAFFWPPFFSLISEKSSKEHRIQALATGRGKMIGYGFLIGAIISIPIFALVRIFIPDNISLMYSPLLIFSLINLIAGYRFYVKVDENLTYEKYSNSMNEGILHTNNEDLIAINEKLEPKEEINKKPRKIFYIGFIALIMVILATSVTLTIYSPFISAYLIETLLSDYNAIIVPIIVMIVYFPAQVISQLVAPLLGRLFDRLYTPLSIVIIGLFKALMIWLMISTLTSIGFAIILIFLYIATESNGYLIQAIMSRISIKHRGKIFGLNMWIDRLGRVIGPLIGGILWDTLTYNTPFIISIYMGLCLIPIFIFAVRSLSSDMVEQVDIDTMGILNVKK